AGGHPGPGGADRRSRCGVRRRCRGERRHPRFGGVPDASRDGGRAAGARPGALPGGVVRLDFSGAPEIAAPPAEVWKRLLDHEFVASVAPGVESVEPIDDRLLKGTAKKLTEHFWDTFAARVGEGARFK